MNKQNKLLYAQSLFFVIIFIFLGVIVITEKADKIMFPVIKKRINSYLNTNYSNIKNNINIDKITYKNFKFKVKITSKENKNHYFYIYYSKRKTTDTYKTDYLEGTKLFKSIKKNLTRKIKSKTNEDCSIEITNNLNNYTSKVQDQIIKEENLSELKFYIIKKELLFDNLNSKIIANEIDKLITNLSSNNITPKYYKITITNKLDITESIEINNITEDFIKNPYKEQIINDIINDNNSLILKQNKITYKYLN